MSANALSAGSPLLRDTTVDLSASIGRTVTLAAGIPAVSASAAVPVVGIVLDARKRVVGSNTNYDNSILLLGGDEVILAKISAAATAISAGDELQQAADGTLTNDAGAGQRLIVGVAISAAVAGDLTAVRIHKPIPRGVITT